MNNEQEMLEALDCWFEAVSTPPAELTEEEIEAIELQAERWYFSMLDL